MESVHAPIRSCTHQANGTSAQVGHIGSRTDQYTAVSHLLGHYLRGPLTIISVTYFPRSVAYFRSSVAYSRPSVTYSRPSVTHSRPCVPDSELPAASCRLYAMTVS